MTTERPVPHLTLTTQEWRLVLTAGLAASYALAWVAFAPHLAVRERVATAAGPPVHNATVWLDDLPAAERPAVALPRGWTIAARDVVPTVARVPARPPRVRTRSS